MEDVSKISKYFLKTRVDPPNSPPNHPLPKSRACPRTKQKNHTKVVNKKVNYFCVSNSLKTAL